jgi:hypothetical protein
MTSVRIEDGRLVMDGPGAYVVSSPIDQTIKVADGKTRSRKLPEEITDLRVEPTEDGITTAVFLLAEADGEGEPTEEVEPTDPGPKVYRRVTDRQGVVLFRSPGPVKFEKKEPVEHQAGIGTLPEPTEDEEAE